MSKSRKHKWYDDFEDGFQEEKRERRFEDRRNKKKIKKALKTKDIDGLATYDE
jgi:hypothetical protein